VTDPPQLLIPSKIFIVFFWIFGFFGDHLELTLSYDRSARTTKKPRARASPPEAFFPLVILSVK